MASLRCVIIEAHTQSNGQGATLTENAGQAALITSQYMGITDPIYPNANGGGSCWPLVIDLGLQVGIRRVVLNTGVGGSRMDDWTGLVGATAVGSATDPLYFHNMGTSSKSISVGTPCTSSSQAGFDLYGFLGDARAKRLEFSHIKDCVVIMENAESEGSTSSAQYQAALVAGAQYHLNTPQMSAILIGLSASGNNSQANMDRLQGAKNAAIDQMYKAGMPVYPGADMYSEFGMRAPTYQERYALGTSVHYIDKAQIRHALRVHQALVAIGY